jgi:histidinol-phosphatase
MNNHSQHMQVALDAVKAAEAVILKYHKLEVRAELKSDMSPVTIADREAEEAIKATIRKAFPDHTFYGEEGEKVNLDSHQGFTWIIDPIDGTKSYLRQNPLFSTLLALMHNGQFVLGVSNAPLMQELVCAEVGRGCYVNHQRVTVSQVSQIEEAYMSYGSLKLFSKANAVEPLVELSKEVRWGRGIGDFWSYHLLAQGKLDIMIEPNTKLWDIAAMKVIIEEAGGKMTQLDGKEINGRTTTALATKGPLHAEIVKRFT